MGARPQSGRWPEVGVGVASAAPKVLLFSSPRARWVFGKVSSARKLGWVPHPCSSKVPLAAGIESGGCAEQVLLVQNLAVWGNSGFWHLFEFQPWLRVPSGWGGLLSKGPFCSWLAGLLGWLSVPLFPACTMAAWVHCFLRASVELFCDRGYPDRSEGVGDEAGKVTESPLYNLRCQAGGFELAVRDHGSH